MQNSKNRVVHHTVQGIGFFFILLWVYAATAKLLDFEAFSVQLGQSPLLSAYAGVLVWLVPLSEYVLSGLLMFPKTRKAGLLGSLSLMTAFTTYIIIILNYADFVPCSCGGILESLGWTEHLILEISGFGKKTSPMFTFLQSNGFRKGCPSVCKFQQQKRF